MEVDDVLVLHLGEDVDLLLDVAHGNASTRCLHPLLLDVPSRAESLSSSWSDHHHFPDLIITIIIMDVAPFTTDPFATGPFTTRLVVKGSVIIIIIIIMIVIIVFGICVRFFLSISWSGVIMMVVYEEVDSETDMVAD